MWKTKLIRFLNYFTIAYIGASANLKYGDADQNNATDISGVDWMKSATGSGDENQIEGRSIHNPCGAYSPCLNGGACSWNGFRYGETQYSCACVGGYSGKNCQTPPPMPRFGECSDNNPCYNGGICHPYTGPAFTCTCVDSFYGPTCQRNRPKSKCDKYPCLNGGKCLESSSEGRVCLCTPAYTGANCEFQIDEHFCRPNPCLNGGTCALSADGIFCSCVMGFRGENCGETTGDVTVGICNPNPCYNQGLCTEARYGETGKPYRCVCPQGYMGTRCGLRPPGGEFGSTNGPCASNPCKGDCRCFESCRHSSGYYCRSPSGYLGKDCTIRIANGLAKAPPVLRCEPNLVTVVFDDLFVQEYDRGVGNSKLILAPTASSIARMDEQCQGKFDGASHYFTINLPFAECGMAVTRSSEGTTVFTNNIWLNRMHGRGFDMPVPVIAFECAYQKQYSIVTSLQPAHSQPIVIQKSGTQLIQGTIELCKVPAACSQTCPSRFSVTQGATYTVGEMIHLNIHRTHDVSVFQEKVALQELFLTCGVASIVNPVWLVRNGCPSRSVPTVITHSGLSSSVCASFQVHRLQNCDTFYIHAKLESCPPSGCVTPAPQVGCSTSGRQKRHLEVEYVDFETYIGDVLGPIHSIYGSEGIAKEILFPDRKKVDYEGQIIDSKPTVVKGVAFHNIKLKDNDSSEVNTTMLVVVVTSFCLLVCGLVLLFLYLHFRKNRSC